MAKYNSILVGCNVRVTAKRPRAGWGEVTSNDIGTVTRIVGDTLTIRFPKQDHWTGYMGEVERVISEKEQEYVVTKPDPRHLKVRGTLQFPDFTHVEVEVLSQSHYSSEFTPHGNGYYVFKEYYIYSLDHNTMGRYDKSNSIIWHKPKEGTLKFTLPVAEYERFRECVVAYNKEFA